MPSPSASPWQTFWKRKNLHATYSNEDRIVRVLREVTELRGKRVLEVGAGTGRDSLPLADDGASVFQLDYSSEALRLARQAALDAGVSAGLVAGDALALPFPDETFDVVLHQGLLEHFRKPEARRLLLENVRVLRRGGLLLVDVPQRYHPYTVLKHILIAMNAWFAGWEREFGVSELEREVSDLNLSPVRTYGDWMHPSLVYRIAREALAKLRLRLPLVPPTIPGVRDIREAIREVLRRRRVALYTCISVGVVARKTETSRDSMRAE